MLLAQELISADIPSVEPSQSITQVLELMYQVGIQHLPLVNHENKLLGLLSENMLLEVPNSDAEVKTLQDFLFFSPVFENFHIYEIARYAVQSSVSTLPVVNKEDVYIGSIATHNLLKAMTDKTGLNLLGGIIVLEIKQSDYSLSEIARVCENNDASIIHLQVNTNDSTDKIVVSIKVNKTRLEALVASFLRYEYTVLDFYGDATTQDNIMDRYSLLMNYINM